MFEGYIVGIFPRNDTLIDIWKKYERNIVTVRIFKEEFDKALEEVVKIQRAAKLSYIHDPQIDWHDMFRPFTALENIVAGPLTRFFENNTLYKKPVIDDIVKYEKGFIDSYIHIDKLSRDNYRWIISLPGPYTFYRLSEFKDRNIGKTSILNILRGTMKDLAGHGYEFIVLHEPALVYYNDVDWNLVNEFYKKLKELDIEYRVQLYFGDIKNKISYLKEIAPYGFSIDTSYTDLNKVRSLISRKSIVGIIDSQNTLMEDAEDLVNKIKGFMERTEVTDIAITPNTDLDYLPYDIAKSKLMLLSKVLWRLGS